MIDFVLTTACIVGAVGAIRAALVGFRTRERVGHGPALAAWITGLALLLVGAYTVGAASWAPSETFRPGWTGAALTGLLLSLFVLAIVRPSSAARALRTGAIAAVPAMIVLTFVGAVVDRAAYDRTGIRPLVVVWVFVAAPAYATGGFLLLATSPRTAPNNVEP